MRGGDLTLESKRDFFVTYTHVDEGWAVWIAWQLERAGYTTVIQAWDFVPGSNWVLEMQEATRCDRTVLVLSPDFLASKFPQAEWAAAFADDPTGERHKLLPVIVRACEPTGLLKPIAPIRLAGLAELDAIRTLVDGVIPGRRKPVHPPLFPGNVESASPRFPRFFRVLLPRNANFVGRDKELVLVRALFERAHTDRPAVVALSGLGGVGKTVIASEFSYRHSTDYDVVWWVRGSTALTIEADLAELASALGLSDGSRQGAELAVDYLGRATNWLLVFDDVGEPKDLLPWIPRGTSGHVLVTSQSTPWREVGGEVQVGVMEPDDSTKLVARLSGDADEGSARRIAELLGHLPLALCEAASFVSASSSSLKAYMRLIDEGKVVLPAMRAPADYGKTLSVVWSHAMREVAASVPEAGNLMSIIAFLAPDDIPEALFLGSPFKPIPPIGDPLALRRAVAALRRFSFVQPTTQAAGLVVHRVVQSVVRSGMRPRDAATCAGWALILLHEAAAALRPNDIKNWEMLERLVPHALEVLKYTDLRADGALLWMPAIGVLQSLGLYLGVRSRFGAAEKLLTRALSICDRTKAPSDAVLIVLESIATTHIDNKEPRAARPYLDRALRIATASKSPAELAEVQNLLGLMCRFDSQYRESIEHYVAALRSYEEAALQDSTSAARALDNLAHVLRAIGENSQAEAYAKSALAIFERSADQTVYDRAIVHDLLASLAHDRDKLDDARHHQETAIRLFETSRGPEHPAVLGARDNLSAILREQGDAKKAFDLSRDAVAGYERQLGPNHPETATALFNLAAAAADLGETSNAAQIMARARGIVLSRYEPGDAEVAKLHISEAHLFAKQKQLPDAIRAAEAALAIRVEHFGLQNPLTMGALVLVHNMYLESGVNDHTISVTLSHDEVFSASDKDDPNRIAKTTVRRGDVVRTKVETTGAKRRPTFDFAFPSTSTVDFIKREADDQKPTR
jgi:tetratricopeptide (TPR) repeat protein